MNFLESAYTILKKANQPLHYTEIAARAMAAGILDTKGQTPEASMGSRLYVDAQKPGSRFKKISRGVFGLAEILPRGISERIEALNKQTRADLQEHLMQMSPDRFEALIGELLLALGFEEETIQVTAYNGDGGVDVRGVLNAGGITTINTAVQAKRWRGNIQAPTVQALRGSLTVHEHGIVITTSHFSKGAIAEAKAPGKAPISLIDGGKLLDLLIQHRIGVTAEEHTVYSLDEEWWGEVAGQAEGKPEPPLPVPTPTPVPPAVVYPLSIRAEIKAGSFSAEMLDAGGRVRYNGVEYQSPSGAGQAATGWKSCNGWTLWQYHDLVSAEWRPIDDLRH